MARPRKLWFRKQTQTWHVQIDGKQHNLGTDNKEEAETHYHKLMIERKEPPKDDHLVVILDKFLQWVQSHQPKSYRWYGDYIQSFVSSHPDLLISQLKPFMLRNGRIKEAARGGELRP